MERCVLRAMIMDSMVVPRLYESRPLLEYLFIFVVIVIDISGHMEWGFSKSDRP
jgi:hypothetical protein